MNLQYHDIHIDIFGRIKASSLDYFLTYIYIPVLKSDEGFYMDHKNQINEPIEAKTYDHMKNEQTQF